MMNQITLVTQYVLFMWVSRSLSRTNRRQTFYSFEKLITNAILSGGIVVTSTKRFNVQKWMMQQGSRVLDEIAIHRNTPLPTVNKPYGNLASFLHPYIELQCLLWLFERLSNDTYKSKGTRMISHRIANSTGSVCLSCFPVQAQCGQWFPEPNRYALHSLHVALESTSQAIAFRSWCGNMRST